MAEAPHHPAIVVIAWNRPRSLLRLLNSIAAARIPQGTTLHISIDAFQFPDVVDCARDFSWPFGEKVVQAHTERLGLRMHVLHGGGLAQRYGSIVLLEDDLVVSPEFYAYALRALDFFAHDSQVAGQSLYAYEVAESSLRPFRPWMDGSDNWFLQMPSSWGAAFSAAQWDAFIQWLNASQQDKWLLPKYVQAWSAQSWKRLHVAYLIATGRFWAYPRFSLSTNFEDAGVHATTKGLFQVPLLMGERDWHFSSLAGSAAVYDAHFDPLPAQIQAICPVLKGYGFDVDLQGAKSVEFLLSEHVLTTRQGGETTMAFDGAALPLEANLSLQLPGNAIRLVRNGTPLEGVPDLEREFGLLYEAERSMAMRLPLHRLPSISVIYCLDADADPGGATLESVLGQDFPGLEVIALVRTGAVPELVWRAFREGKLRLLETEAIDGMAIARAVGAASGHWIWVLDQPCMLRPDVARTLAHMFRHRQELFWVTGLPTSDEPLISKRMALYRWDSERFAAAGPDQLRAFLPAALQVFQKELWLRAGGDSPDLYQRLRSMATATLPTVAGLDLVDAWNAPTIPGTWGRGKLNASRKHYHRHVPILWKMHFRSSDYKPVLRWDPDHKTWFEWEY